MMPLNLRLRLPGRRAVGRRFGCCLVLFARSGLGVVAGMWRPFGSPLGQLHTQIAGISQTFRWA